MFVKINRSCVVNMSMIDDIVKNELYLKNGKVLYIARDYKIKVKEKHIKYYFRYADDIVILHSDKDYLR